MGSWPTPLDQEPIATFSGGATPPLSLKTKYLSSDQASAAASMAPTPGLRLVQFQPWADTAMLSLSKGGPTASVLPYGPPSHR